VKQRISVENLSELTAEQKDRLRDWWKPVKGDWYCYLPIKFVDVINTSLIMHLERIKKDHYPLLSIGQCIELLKNNNAFKRDYDEGSFAQLPGAFITLCWDERDCPEFIDALWQAVKKVL
jgi:hypothetical protein